MYMIESVILKIIRCSSDIKVRMKDYLKSIIITLFLEILVIRNNRKYLYV